MAEVPRGDIFTKLNFVKAIEDGQEPYYIYIRIPPPEGKPFINIKFAPTEINIQDLRGKLETVNLNKDSIQILTNLTKPKVDFDDITSIETIYYPAVIEQIKKNIPSAHKVHIFRHALRNTGDPKKYAPAALFAHVDQTGPAVVNRIRKHLGPESEDLLEGRYRLIHFWQSLNGPAVVAPLAFASSQSVPDSDISPIISHLKDGDEDFIGARWSEGQKWYYLSGADTDEAILLQLFDSKAGEPGSEVLGGRAVHSAFIDPRTPNDAPPRFSIEVSALVFGD